MFYLYNGARVPARSMFRSEQHPLACAFAVDDHETLPLQHSACNQQRQWATPWASLARQRVNSACTRARQAFDNTATFRVDI